MITIRGIWSKGFTCIHLEKEIDPTLSYLPWMGSSPTKNLRFHVTLGRNSWRRWSSTNLKLSPTLDWVGIGNFWKKGFGERGARGEGELNPGRMNELVRKRESSLNIMGPKTVEIRFNRSDRLPRPVVPVWPRLTRNFAISWFAV